MVLRYVLEVNLSELGNELDIVWERGLVSGLSSYVREGGEKWRKNTFMDKIKHLGLGLLGLRSLWDVQMVMSKSEVAVGIWSSEQKSEVLYICVSSGVEMGLKPVGMRELILGESVA